MEKNDRDHIIIYSGRWEMHITFWLQSRKHLGHQHTDGRPPTVLARARSQITSSVGQSDTVADFLQIFIFALPILIPPTDLYSLTVLSSMLCSLDTYIVIKRRTKKLKIYLPDIMCEYGGLD
jgi:hypothetical protein